MTRKCCDWNVQMTLYEAGKDAMEKEFKNLLARHGRPVPPGSLLDVLALEHGKCHYLPIFTRATLCWRGY